LGDGETKFGFSVHVNQIWHVVSLYPRDGHGGWFWGVGVMGPKLGFQRISTKFGM